MFITALGYIFYFLFLHVLTAYIYSSILFFFLDEILYVNQTTGIQILLIHVGPYSHFYAKYTCMM